MLTVVGLLVYSIIQRQVRLYLHTHAQQIPGNKGLTATPTAAVVLTVFAQVALIQLVIDGQEMEQLYGVQPYHLLLCDRHRGCRVPMIGTGSTLSFAAL
jgi:hypothetical protein